MGLEQQRQELVFSDPKVWSYMRTKISIYNSIHFEIAVLNNLQLITYSGGKQQLHDSSKHSKNRLICDQYF